MIKQKLISLFLMAMAGLTLFSNANIIRLKTENMDDVIGISSFVMNGKGELFLYSQRLFRIFKFKPDGTFDKSFCRKGEGPGEITRVLWMFHNPVNDYLYLPEFSSQGKGRVTIYDSDGNFKGLLTPQISRPYMDRIKKIIFFNDGTYAIVTSERVNWKPYGKFFITQNEILTRYFDSEGKFAAEICKDINMDELTHAVRWGGPQILFKPSVLVKKTPDDRYIASARTDENHITLYDKQGKKIKDISLEISREKLTGERFEAAKKGLMAYFEGKTEQSRMLYLAKNMIKLEYQPFYINLFLTPVFIILEKMDTRDRNGYTGTSRLIFFDWSGKKKGEKIIDGYVMNVKDDRGLIISYDEESNEYFRVESIKMESEK
jgi:hypothetical protein